MNRVVLHCYPQDFIVRSVNKNWSIHYRLLLSEEARQSWRQTRDINVLKTSDPMNITLKYNQPLPAKFMKEFEELIEKYFPSEPTTEKRDE